MAKKITVNLWSDKSVASAAQKLRAYAAWIEKKEAELRIRLASLGASVASIRFSRAVYIGTNDVSVRVDDTGNTAVIYAEGSAVAFIEFGSGKTYGYGHPNAGEHGFGPSTWSLGEEGKGHWDSPNGWWLPKDKGGGHSYGNPPAMAMVAARDAMVEDLTRIAKEVFGTS